MNKQLRKKGDQAISRGIEWVGTTWTPDMTLRLPSGCFWWTRPDGKQVWVEDNGYTSNPVAGCHYQCRWTMPDGSEAICYAERVAEGLAQKAYPEGFARETEHNKHSFYWRPEETESWHRISGAEVFVGSMADMWGWWVDDTFIVHILTEVERTNNTYYFLSKNPMRYTTIQLHGHTLPRNALYGASVPASSMNGRLLTEKQRDVYLDAMCYNLSMTRQAGARTWLSIEPLSWNVAPAIAEWLKKEQFIDWAVIGAATNGPKAYQPRREWVADLVEVLKNAGVKVFFKGNIKYWPEIGWWEEKPS